MSGEREEVWAQRTCMRFSPLLVRRLLLRRHMQTDTYMYILLLYVTYTHPHTQQNDRRLTDKSTFKKMMKPADAESIDEIEVGQVAIGRPPGSSTNITRLTILLRTASDDGSFLFFGRPPGDAKRDPATKNEEYVRRNGRRKWGSVKFSSLHRINQSIREKEEVFGFRILSCCFDL